jgi:hypothetical protein
MMSPVIRKRAEGHNTDERAQDGEGKDRRLWTLGTA